MIIPLGQGIREIRALRRDPINGIRDGLPFLRRGGDHREGQPGVQNAGRKLRFLSIPQDRRDPELGVALPEAAHPEADQIASSLLRDSPMVPAVLAVRPIRLPCLDNQGRVEGQLLPGLIALSRQDPVDLYPGRKIGILRIVSVIGSVLGRHLFQRRLRHFVSVGAQYGHIQDRDIPAHGENGGNADALQRGRGSLLPVHGLHKGQRFQGVEVDPLPELPDRGVDHGIIRVLPDLAVQHGCGDIVPPALVQQRLAAVEQRNAQSDNQREDPDQDRKKQTFPGCPSDGGQTLPQDHLESLLCCVSVSTIAHSILFVNIIMYYIVFTFQYICATSFRLDQYISSLLSCSPT